MRGAARQVGLRLRGARALRAGLLTAGPAAFAWILLRFSASLGLVPETWLLPAALGAGGVILAAMSAAALISGLSGADAIQEVDRRLQARGRLIAAWELADDPAPMAAVAVSDARGWLARGDVLPARIRAAFPVRLPPLTSRSFLLVALAAVSGFLLSDVDVDWNRRAVAISEPAITPARLPPPDRLLAALSPADVPTFEWAMKKLQAPADASDLAPELNTEPRPKTTPASLASTSVDRSVPILDSQARAFFEAMTSEEMRREITNEIGDYYTGSGAPEAFEYIEARATLERDPTFGEMPEGNQSEGIDLEPFKMPGQNMGGDIAMKVDPTESRHEYIQGANVMAELGTAMKESFNAYLQEFADQVLQGLEDGLKRGLTSGKGSGDLAHRPDELPPSPGGMSDAEPGPGGPAGEDRPFFAARSDTDAPPSAYVPGTPQSVGGTAAGGVGAGAGNGEQSGAAMPVSEDPATGPRLDLRGSLTERLAVVEVVERMRQQGIPTDGPEAEVVRKITREAEGEALNGTDVPPEYRDTIAAYFRTLSATQSPETP